MKQASRALTIFLGALLLADQVDNALVNAARRQRLAHLEHGAWWPVGYPAMEALEFGVHAVLFGILGALLSILLKQRRLAVVLACLLGLAFSALTLVAEPSLLFARYSHAPAWLWALSWSALYMPVPACALGAMMASKLSPDRTPHAA
jgi:hypothetical protein